MGSESGTKLGNASRLVIDAQPNKSGMKDEVKRRSLLAAKVD
jgi:hypothetical protein